MTDSLRGQIALLRQLTPQLNAVTDDAARIVQVVEHFLTEECRLGIQVVIVTNNEIADDGTEFQDRLEYSRIDGKFRLVVSEATVRIDDETHIRQRNPWANCTRDVKLASFRHIPDLLAAISRKVSQTIETSEKAAEVVTDLLEELGIDTQKMRKSEKPKLPAPDQKEMKPPETLGGLLDDLESLGIDLTKGEAQR